MDGGAWWATVHGTAKNQTWLSTRALTREAEKLPRTFWSGFIQAIDRKGCSSRDQCRLWSIVSVVFFFFFLCTGYFKENKTKCWTVLKNQEKVLLACSCTYFSHILVQKPHDALHLADTRVLNRLHTPSSSCRDSPRILSSHWEIIFPIYVLMMTGLFPSCCSSSSGE